MANNNFTEEIFIIGGIQRFSIEDGPGIRTIVFTKGYPLSCRWFHNPELIDSKQQLIVKLEKCIGDWKYKEICKKIPENPPETFYEALQFIFFTQLILHIEANTSGCGFGRFDQYMHPYYKADLDKGIIDKETAKELLSCFYLKLGEYVCIADHWFAVSFAGYTTWQILMIASFFQ